MITWHTETRMVADLKPADYNPRKITEKEKADLKASLDTYGQVMPIIINIGSRNNIIIGGHQRTEIYKDDGVEMCEVNVPSRELTLEEEMELNLRLNRNQAQFDYEKLGENFDIETLLKVGFSDEELAGNWNDVDLLDEIGRPMGDGAGKDEITPRMEPGDVYQMGDHRIIVGKFTKRDLLQKLMDGDKAHFVYLDTPKTIAFKSPDSGKMEMNTHEDYEGYIGIVLEHSLLHSHKDAHALVWIDENEVGTAQFILHNLGLQLQRTCIWIKPNFEVNPKIAFSKVYEPAVYATRGKPYLDKKHGTMNEILNPSVNAGQVADELSDMFNLWLVEPNGDEKGKPINLLQKPLRRCTAPGHIVIDLIGSLGTIMACEQMQRKARIMVDTPMKAEEILLKYEEWTGKKAEKVTSFKGSSAASDSTATHTTTKETTSDAEDVENE